MGEDKKIVLTSTLTCPDCGHAQTMIMPTDACQFFLECMTCHAVLRPKDGDCCVYCSYRDVPCPPVQRNDTCCA
ncbi:GDCCVxC domain-containing (seleno)protein [Roseovarius sp. MBR-79]